MFKTGLKLGSDPLKYGAVELDKHIDSSAAIPSDWSLPVSDYRWGMLGNDAVGDCVEAAMLHGDEAFYLEQGISPYPYQTPHALSLYSAIAGYNPDDPNTDQGTDPSQAMQWWVNNGLTAVIGHPGRHALAAFGSLPGYSGNLRRMIWEFGAVLLSLGLPNDWQNDVNASGEAHWRGANHGSQADGHEVVAVGYDQNLIRIVTWGNGSSDFDNAWGGAYVEQCFVPLSRELLNRSGVSPSGLNYDSLRQDLPPQ